jgi:cellulose synthase/poly-beta-1,6-N-acetylglucosamine synthase-like glycosyltransferase
MSQYLLIVIKLIYSISMVGMAIYGLYNLVMVGFYFHGKKKTAEIKKLKPPKEWPSVTIQLPIFNEKNVIDRLLRYITRLDYPLEKLQIQVLDDSTDDTVMEVCRLVESYKLGNINIELIHRANRNGFKGGALIEGLKSATGEFVAIFDADFMPASDWLKRVIMAFDEEKIGCVQTRWGHTNTAHSPFTRSISLALNGHFVVEQAARSDNGLFFGFNGTAGIWRRACIEDAGGWQPDTLTEDLDLSYRAELKGWRFRYLPEIVVPSELPSMIESFKKQQYRWAKGCAQTAKKLYPRMLKANIPEHVRIMGMIHLGGYFISLLMVLSFLALILLGLYDPHYLSLFPYTLVTSLGPPLLYMVSRAEDFPHLGDRIKAFPLLMLIGYGISLNNAVAVLDGLISTKVGTFVRTPKYNDFGKGRVEDRSGYTFQVSPMVWVELLFSLIAFYGVYLLYPKLGWSIVPWMLLYAFGYAFIALFNLSQSIRNSSGKSPRLVVSNNPTNPID